MSDSTERDFLAQVANSAIQNFNRSLVRNCPEMGRRRSLRRIMCLFMTARILRSDLRPWTQDERDKLDSHVDGCAHCKGVLATLALAMGMHIYAKRRDTKPTRTELRTMVDQIP